MILLALSFRLTVTYKNLSMTLLLILVERIASTHLVGSDALACMLEVVLSGKANYILNQKYSTFATQVSEIVKRQLYGSTAVVGAGIYGTTAALGTYLATVDIFDSNEDLLQVRLVFSTESTAAIIIPDHLTLSFVRNEVSFKKTIW